MQVSQLQRACITCYGYACEEASPSICALGLLFDDQLSGRKPCRICTPTAGGTVATGRRELLKALTLYSVMYLEKRVGSYSGLMVRKVHGADFSYLFFLISIYYSLQPMLSPSLSHDSSVRLTAERLSCPLDASPSTWLRPATSLRR